MHGLVQQRRRRQQGMQQRACACLLSNRACSTLMPSGLVVAGVRLIVSADKLESMEMTSVLSVPRNICTQTTWSHDSLR